MSQSPSDQRRPFLSAPSPKRYFAAAAIEEARQRIVRAIARNEGPAILVGGAGTGKSLLLAVLAEQFAAKMSVVTLAGAQLCTRKALLQVILCELGLPYRGMDEGELRLSILQHLRGHGAPAPANTKDARHMVSRHRPDAAQPRRMLLLVDEADALPTRLLEELRVLTNVAADGLPLVSLVLGGSPILEERFADPQLDMFSQRIAARCYLAPLGREESMLYVSSQVAAAGIKPERLFTADALEAIHSATGGVPRLINQLGDQLSWMAEETGVAPLDAALVQQAWSDLQQLPAPWNSHGAAAGATADGVIEFGDLDALGNDAPTPTRRAEPLLRRQTDVLDGDDELPASIPFATAGPNRLLEATLDVDEFDATIEATEHLLESFDEFDELEVRPANPAPTLGSFSETPFESRRDSTKATAQNPFDEPFDQEEIVLDPYAAFESELLRTAPHVLNRLDRAFAGELHRCVVRSANKPTTTTETNGTIAAEGAESLTAVIEKPAPVRLHDVARIPAAPDVTGDLLIIEDDDQPAAAIIPGRHFRRLFSTLESAGSVRASY